MFTGKQDKFKIWIYFKIKVNKFHVAFLIKQYVLRLILTNYSFNQKNFSNEIFSTFKNFS